MTHTRPSTRFSLRPLCIALMLCGAAGPAAAIQTLVARTGDAAPGLTGVTYTNNFFYGQVNNAGQVAYFAWLNEGGASTSSLWRDSTLVAKGGTAAPGLTGVNYGVVDTPQLNESGQVTYYSSLTGTDVTGSNNTAIWRSGALVAREGNASGLGTGVNLGAVGYYPRINDAGQVSFQSYLVGTGTGTSNDTALWIGTSAVVREGDAAPGLTGVTFGDLQSVPLLSAGGTPVFSAFLTGTGVTSANDASLWRDDVLIAREGNAAPGLTGVNYGNVSSFRVNASGQVAYMSSLSGTGVTTDNDSALWRDGTLVMREGNATSIASSVNYGLLLSTPEINDAGQVGFYTRLTGAGVTSANNEAVWRSGTLIAREGDAAPHLPGLTLSDMGSYISVINAGGQMTFMAYLVGAGVDSTNNLALWIGDGGTDSILVVRKGDALAGSTVTGLNYSEHAMNDYGQVTYLATLANGQRAQMLFTPELHWRRTFSSTWDSASNWSAGIAPAMVHPVIIDPASSVTVTGPSTDRTVRSLTVGGGNGVATLELSSGVITLTDGSALIQSGGILTGDGKLVGSVTNRGTVQAQNLTFTGALDNAGLVTGGTNPNRSRINARLANQTGGEVRVGAAEFLRLNGTGHTNAGQVEVAGGDLQIDGDFTNQSSGRILLNDGSVRFRGGLGNTGQLTVTFGESSVFGTLVNETAGKIIVSQGAQTTFYDGITNRGTFRVSEGGAATLFGQLRGNVTTGTGSVRLEGGWSPGFSPSLYTVTNAISLESELMMYLQGTLPGFCEATAGAGCHSKLIFENTIDLGAGSSLNVVLENGYGPALGDAYDLFDWGTGRSGEFGVVSLPSLAPGLVWDTAGLYDDGVIRVAAVPEPESWALLVTGLALVGTVTFKRRHG